MNKAKKSIANGPNTSRNNNHQDLKSKLHKTDKSVGKTRDLSKDKEPAMVKTKTVANLTNFSKTAKNIKNDGKRPSNKSAIQDKEKDNYSTAETNKNKTFVADTKKRWNEKR